MSDLIDIHEEIFALCRKLGLEPETVSEIVFRPADVTATVYLVNDHGQKYLADADGRPASETRAFKVST